MKTLAELKRDAQKGNLYFELVYRYGNEIPERLKGKRRLCRANSVAVFFEKDGKESELQIKTSKTIDYNDDFLTVYEPLHRELTDIENKEYKAYLDDMQNYVKENPYSEPYWHSLAYWEKHKEFKYLQGSEFINGKRYNASENKIIDYQFKGEKILQYKRVKEI